MNDCALSPWLEWSKPSATCGQTTQIRKREIQGEYRDWKLAPIEQVLKNYF